MHSVAYLTVLFLAVCLSGGRSQAQSYQKRSVYDFAEDTIEAVGPIWLYELLIVRPKRLQSSPPNLASRIALLNRKISQPNKTKVAHATLLWDLAIAYAQEQQNWLEKAYALYPKIEQSAGAAKVALVAQQKRVFRIANNCQKKVIASYKALLCAPNADDCAASALSKSLANPDEALHLAVYFLRAAAHLAEAEALSERLLSEYPKSTYASDALLFLAEQASSSGALPRAHELYERVQAIGTRDHRSFALYRMAWIQHELGKDTQALERLFSVVEMTRGQPKLSYLHRRAKRDFARMYAFAGNSGAAYAAFNLVDKSSAIPMMQLLGAELMKQGKEHDTMTIYRSLLRHAPVHTLRCDWQAKLVLAGISNGRMDVLLHAFHNLVAEVKVTRANTRTSAKTISACHDQSSSLLSEQATIWHSESATTLNPHLLSAAIELYELFLSTFPVHKKVAEVEYFYAEALWRTAAAESDTAAARPRWQRAAEAFSKVVRRAKVSRREQKESAYAAALAWQNTRPVDRRLTIPISRHSKIIQPRKLAERQRKTIQAFDAYRTFVKDPHDDEVVTMMYLKARIYWRHDQLHKASVLFENILNTNSSHATAPYAANLLLDTLVRLGKRAELNSWVDKLLANRDLLSGQEELKKQLLLLKSP